MELDLQDDLAFVCWPPVRLTPSEAFKLAESVIRRATAAIVTEEATAHEQPRAARKRNRDASAVCGMPKLAISSTMRRCSALGSFNAETLRTHFRDELDVGATKANVEVARFLFQTASGRRGDGNGAVTSAIFWAKTRMRWKETARHEISGPDGAPLEMSEDDRQRDLAQRRQALQTKLRAAFGDAITLED